MIKPGNINSLQLILDTSIVNSARTEGTVTRQKSRRATTDFYVCHDFVSRVELRVRFVFSPPLLGIEASSPIIAPIWAAGTSRS